MAQASRSEIETLLQVIRGQAVLLDTDIAELYGVSTKRVNQAVKRNVARFPVDFVFRLTEEEFTSLKASNNSDAGPGGRRFCPYAFTEQGAGMLASVLKTAAATKVSIAILRAFARFRSAEDPEYSRDRAAGGLFAAIRDAMLMGRDEMPYTTAAPYTYFLQAGDDGPIKIGSTKNLPVRLRTLRAMFPGPLRLLGVIKGDVEEACHMRFGIYRLRGEWFVPSAALLDFIRAKAAVPQGAEGATKPRRPPALIVTARSGRDRRRPASSCP